MAVKIESDEAIVLFNLNRHTHEFELANALETIGAKSLGGMYERVDPEKHPIGDKPVIIAQVVRHHCDRFYEVWKRRQAGRSSDEFLELIKTDQYFITQPDMYTSDCNYILRYESLQHELDILSINTGLPAIALDKQPTATQWYDQLPLQTQMAIGEIYKDEMEFLGYKV